MYVYLLPLKRKDKPKAKNSKIINGKGEQETQQDDRGGVVEVRLL